MKPPTDPDGTLLSPGQPTRDLLLAQALEACIVAERRLAGSSLGIISRQPAWARADLRELVDVAESLKSATSNSIMSRKFRAAARARLMQRISADARAYTQPAQLHVARLTGVPAKPDRVAWRWHKTFCVRPGAAAGLAAVLGSTSELPGSAE
ncbi:MAG: hypothetical protein ACR2IK_09535 [Chloroflexota bacterium]